MKKIILFSFLVIATAAMTSCSADAVTDHPTNTTQENLGSDTGGQNGQITVPKP
jgi:hypothetical protein